MFKDEYQDYMSEVRPENSLVESMVELQRNQRSQRTVKPARAIRVAAAALCGLLVFSGGTIAVDAATGGGVQRLLGIKDSISVGDVKTEFVLIEPEQFYAETENNHPEADESIDANVEKKEETAQNPNYPINTMESKMDEEGNISTVIRSSTNAPVFSCSFSIREGSYIFQMACSVKDCVTPEDFAWTVYVQLAEMMKLWRKNEAMCKEVISELERVKQEIGTGTDMKDGCAMGVQFMIDDLKTNHDGTEELVYIDVCDYNDTDGDGDRAERIGFAIFKIDFDAWKNETEETGKTEFDMESVAGVDGMYHFTIFSYEPALSYQWERIN